MPSGPVGQAPSPGRLPRFSFGRGSSAALIVLFLVNVLNFYDRQAIGAVLEPLRLEFHLSDTQLGALTTVFTLVYAVAGLPLGRMADTRSRRELLAIGAAVWAGLTGAGALAGSYAALLITRLGVGIGEAVCGPAATSWIADIFPAGRRARAMAAFMLAVPLGGMLSFAVTGPAAQAYGWRIALAIAALPAAALVPALLLLPEPPRETGSATVPAGGGGSLWKIPGFTWIVVSGAIVNFALYSFSTFLPAFLTRFHGLSVAKAGLWAGLGAGAAGLFGAGCAAAFGDRVSGRRGRGRTLLAAGAALAAAPLGFAAISRPAGDAALALALIMTAYGLLQSYYGLVYAAIQDIAPAGSRGGAMGTYFMAMYLCGASFGPLATGRLSDYFAHEAAAGGPVTAAALASGLRDAMYLIPALSIALAAALWMAARSMTAASRPE